MFTSLFAACGIRQWNNIDLLTPLITSDFVFERNQYCSLGDAVIRSVMADATCDYALHSGLMLTPNTCSEVVAVMHNAHSLRLFAERLGFPQLATLGFRARAAAGDKALGELLLLQAPENGPRGVDKAGTAFELPLLRCAQSQLGPQLSHFFGALCVDQGRPAAAAAVRSVWALPADGSAGANFPRHVVATLFALLERYPASSVAQSLLAAQGIATAFSSRSVSVPLAETSATSGKGQRPAADHSDASKEPFSPHSKESGATGGESTVQDSSVASMVAAASQNNAMDFGWRSSNEAVNPLTSFAAGPGVVDLIAKWREQRAITDAESAKALQQEGWFEGKEQTSAGVAHDAPISMSSYFADKVGVPFRCSMTRVANKRGFEEPVDDQAFFSRSATREGIEIDTNGVPVSDFVESFLVPHARKFAVTLCKVQVDRDASDVVLGCGVAERYTEARTRACGDYIDRVLHDIERMVKSARA